MIMVPQDDAFFDDNRRRSEDFPAPPLGVEVFGVTPKDTDDDDVSLSFEDLLGDDTPELAHEDDDVSKLPKTKVKIKKVKRNASCPDFDLLGVKPEKGKKKKQQKQTKKPRQKSDKKSKSRSRRNRFSDSPPTDAKVKVPKPLPGTRGTRSLHQSLDSIQCNSTDDESPPVTAKEIQSMESSFTVVPRSHSGSPTYARGMMSLHHSFSANLGNAKDFKTTRRLPQRTKSHSITLDAPSPRIPDRPRVSRKAPPRSKSYQGAPLPLKAPVSYEAEKVSPTSRLGTWLPQRPTQSRRRKSLQRHSSPGGSQTDSADHSIAAYSRTSKSSKSANSAPAVEALSKRTRATPLEPRRTKSLQYHLATGNRPQKPQFLDDQVSISVSEAVPRAALANTGGKNARLLKPSSSRKYFKDTLQLVGKWKKQTEEDDSQTLRPLCAEELDQARQYDGGRSASTLGTELPAFAELHFSPTKSMRKKASIPSKDSLSDAMEAKQARLLHYFGKNPKSERNELDDYWVEAFKRNYARRQSINLPATLREQSD